MLMPLPSRSLAAVTPPSPSSGAELVTVDGRSLPLVGARLVGEARGGIARLVLEQRFENRFDDTLRVIYRMPLPVDGAVSAYAFEIGGRVIAGRVHEKAEARERFERAIAHGHTAALLEQDRAEIFTQEIGNLPAGEAITARITIDQRLVWLDEGEWELRFPTVIGPRYVGAADRDADARATRVAVAPGMIPARISIELRVGDQLVEGRRPASPTHVVKLAGDRVELRSEHGARLDRDIVVRWPVASREVGLALDSARVAAGGAYGLLTIVPPAAAARPELVARDLIVLLDTSGSMGGSPLDAAKRVVAQLIESLGDRDRLELIEFSNSPRRYLNHPVAATPAAKQAAIRWVQSRQAGGGTEMADGVREALRALRDGAQRQVVVVTDGYVGGERQIVRLLHDQLPEACRLHVLGVGAAVNRGLATALARAGRGVEVIANLDEDSERAAARLIARTRAPVLVDVQIHGSAVIAHAPERLSDVFAGAPIVAALELRPEGGELVVRGSLANDTWEQRLRVPARRPGEGNQAIAALFGREKVADLETFAAIGEVVDREIAQLGVAFQIATRMTSWVAVDETRAVERPARTEAMPQELPYGTSAASFGLRGRRATTITTAVDALSALHGDLGEDFDDAPLGGSAEELSGADFGEPERTLVTKAISIPSEFDDEEPTGNQAFQSRAGGGPEGRALTAKHDLPARLGRPSPAPAPVVHRPRPGPAPVSVPPPPPPPEPTVGAAKLRAANRPRPSKPRRARPIVPILMAMLLLAVLAALAWWLLA